MDDLKENIIQKIRAHLKGKPAKTEAPKKHDYHRQAVGEHKKLMGNLDHFSDAVSHWSANMKGEHGLRAHHEAIAALHAHAETLKKHLGSDYNPEKYAGKSPSATSKAK